jgi:hypothetical protein
VSLGFIVPFPLPTPEGWTADNGTMVVLPIEAEDSSLYRRPSSPRSGHGGDVRKQLRQQLEDIKPSLLLFLNKLVRIEVRDQEDIQNQVCRIMSKEIISRQGDEDTGTMQVVELSDTHKRDSLSDLAQVTKHSTTKWLVVDRTLETDIHRPSRPEVRHTKLSIAVPLLALDGRPPDSRDVHAFLPLRSYGFPFVIQGDWDVPSSREAVDASSSWNCWLRAKVPALFLEAMMSLVRMSAQAARRRSSGAAKINRKDLDKVVQEDEDEEEDDEEDPDEEDEEDGDLREGEDSGEESEFHLLAIAFSMIPLPQQANDFFKNIPSAVLSLLRVADIIPTAQKKAGELLFVKPTAAVKRPAPKRKIDAYTEFVLQRRGYHFLHPRVTLPPGLRC